MRNRNLYIKLIAASILFGVAAAIIKGDGAGARDALGNLSAPWLLLPFCLGGSARTVRGAAGRGAVGCILALVAFYFVDSVAYGLVNGSTTIIDGVVLLGGAVGSPLCGMLGFYWFRRRAWLAGLSAGVLLLAEPMAQWLPWRLYALRGDTESVFRYPVVYAVEVLVGLTLSIWAIGTRRTRGTVEPNTKGLIV